MKVTHRFAIPSDKTLYNQLRFYQQEAARVWNDTLTEAVLYWKVFRRWMPVSRLEEHRKQQYSLHSQSIQAIVHKYDECRRGTAEKRRKGDRRAKYPWRRKRFFCIPIKQNGFEVQGGQIILKFKNDKPVLASMLQTKAGPLHRWLEQNPIPLGVRSNQTCRMREE